MIFWTEISNTNYILYSASYLTNFIVINKQHDKINYINLSESELPTAAQTNDRQGFISLIFSE